MLGEGILKVIFAVGSMEIRMIILNKVITPLLFVLTLAGCQSLHNFSHVQIANLGSPNIKQDPGTSLAQYSSFAVFPDDEAQDELMEKQVLYLAASALEGCGYEQVGINSTPDLLLTVGFSNEYKSTYIPPATYSIPIYNPGQTYTTNTNAHVHSPYGNFYGTAQSTTTTPGYWSSQSYTRPGYTTGRYYPAVSVSLWDSDSNELIWRGSNVGTSPMENFGITAPFVLSNIAARIPVNCASNYVSGLLTGSFGEMEFFYTYLSRDGSVYFPTVTGIPKGSSAKKAGLRVWDMVIEIGGKPTANIGVKDLIDLCTGSIGETVSVKVFRMGKVLNVQLQLERLSIETRQSIRRRCAIRR